MSRDFYKLRFSEVIKINHKFKFFIVLEIILIAGSFSLKIFKSKSKFFKL